MLTSSFSLEAFEYLLQQLNVAAGLFQMRFERLLQFGIGRAMRDDERWSGAPLGVDVPRLPSGTQLFQLDRGGHNPIRLLRHPARLSRVRRWAYAIDA